MDVGTYKVTVDAAGFQKTEFQMFDVAARETKRLDVDLKVATQAQTVIVEAVATIQTDVSNIAETKGSLELTDLPVAIYTRSQGSTSAFSTLTAQPGVQTDPNNNITVAGASPAQIGAPVACALASSAPLGRYGESVEVRRSSRQLSFAGWAGAGPTGDELLQLA